MVLILAADIGGTNSRFGVFEADGRDALVLKESAWIRTHDASSFSELLHQLPAKGISTPLSKVDSACFAIPGAIVDGMVGLTPNIEWDIDLNKEGKEFTIRSLVNDFAAQAYACKTAVVKDALVIQQGSTEKDGNIAVLGAGTGLGHSLLISVGSRYHAVPSEGGHMAYPFVGQEEYEFEAFARGVTKRNFCDGDTVVTGSGLSLLHKFLTGEDLDPATVAASIAPESETCRWYARFYGRAARNWVLATTAWRGLFLSGGVAAKNPMFVQVPEFIHEFQAYPKYEKILGNIPVRLNTNEQSGLFGAALCGLQMMNG